MNGSSPDREAWNQYWRDGRGAACQSDDQGLYQGIIGARWRAILAALSGARLLDVACGNGAIERLAADADRPGPLEIHATDAAAIHPPDGPWPDGLTCRFHPETPNERLPFAAGTFDGCVSQYGVEYGDLEASVAEIARVLKPGGWVCWICHWRDGDLARDAAAEIERADRLRALDLPGRIAALIGHQHRDGRWIPDSHRRTWHLPAAAAVKQGLSAGFGIARATPQRANGNLGLFLHNLAHLYQHREQHPVDEVVGKLRECGDALAGHRARLEALVGASLDAQRLAILARALRDAGLPVQRETLLTDPASGRTVGIEIHAGASPPPASIDRSVQTDPNGDGA